jgi:hypothetical protein
MKTKTLKTNQTVSEINPSFENQFDEAILQLGLKIKFEEDEDDKDKD